MKPMSNNLSPTPADAIQPGSYVHLRGEYSRVKHAGPALHPKHGRIVRIELESGAVCHFAPYATIDVLAPSGEEGAKP